MFKRIILFLSVGLASYSMCQARIGESRSKLESRILTKRVGVKYAPDTYNRKILENKKLPYYKMLEYLPEGVEHFVYFKPAEDRQASRSDVSDPKKVQPGWDLHVIFYRGKSVFEAYRRNGDAISNFELSGLLILNGRNSRWLKDDELKAKKPAESFLGITYMLADGSVLATKRGNTLLFFTSELDEHLFQERKKIRDEKYDEAQKNAPHSVKGF